MICGGYNTKENCKTYSSMLPIVSVVTVVYNGCDFLENTIKSVLDQTYENIEYIIIDGGSTDGTLEIIKKYEDKIAYWQSEPDNGIYDAMNKAIMLVSGQWVNFMNCGDTFYDVNTISSVFTKDICNYSVVFGNVIKKWKGFDEVCLPDYADVSMPFCHQSSFTKTEFLIKYRFDTKYKICADRNFYYTLQKNGDYNPLYLNINISNFDCINGVSSNNELLLLKEKADIENISKTSYLKQYIKIRIKNVIRKYFPSIVEKIRMQRSKKEKN